MGTTATGAIDDLSSLCSLAHDFDAWFHVDAAYGGFFALLDEVKSDIAGIELADSLSVDARCNGNTNRAQQEPSFYSESSCSPLSRS